MSESDAIAIPAPARVLAALSAGEMPAVQQQLTEWLTKKLATLTADIEMFTQNIEHARKSKWKTTGWEGLRARTRRLHNYYEKIMAAVNAGYVIIPDLGAEAIAVRVDRAKPRRHEGTWRRSGERAEPDSALAPGEGRYVDDKNFTDSITYDRLDPKAPTYYFATDFDDQIDFPMLVVKPVVLEATQRAMSLRIFDRIGVVGARRKDPLVVGEILGPNGKMQCFFIAWWLDPETL